METSVILSYGLGVESSAILARWLIEPETCPCNLSNLTVLTAMLGSEWRDTIRLVTDHILPLLRQHVVRYVQISRGGRLEESGIVVLSDTRQPTELFVDGAYRLKDELSEAGIVPSFSGPHTCSLKNKAVPIERWMRDFYAPSSFSHAIGYNNEEFGRVRSSEEANAVRNVAFGFNVDEMVRVNGGIAYDTPERKSIYPLVEWRWSRQDCIDYLFAQFGVLFPKSACSFCPFSYSKKGLRDLVERQKMFPDQTADALMLEHMSLALNPRGTLYSGTSLVQLAIDHKNTVALDIHEEALTASEWAVYRVRRIYSAKAVKDGPSDPAKKGNVQRAVEKLDVYPSSDEAVAALRMQARSEGAEVEQVNNIVYRYVERRGATYPARENFLVAAPNLVETKARYGIEKFNARFDPEQFDMSALWAEPVSCEIATALSQ
jgi:hypothetical protein